MYTDKERYQELGMGTENLTVRFHRFPDRVVKFARQLYLWRNHSLNEQGQNATKARVKTNLAVVQRYIDSEFLPKTDVKSFGNVWWTQQEMLPVFNSLSSDNVGLSPILIPKMLEVFDQAEVMHRETGLYLDWFGFDRMGEVVQTALSPGYWSVPNLVTTDDSTLKIFDLGLYQDNNRTDVESRPAVSAFTDALVCKIQLALIERIRTKVSQQPRIR